MSVELFGNNIKVCSAYRLIFHLKGTFALYTASYLPGCERLEIGNYFSNEK